MSATITTVVTSNRQPRNVFGDGYIVKTLILGAGDADCVEPAEAAPKSMEFALRLSRVFQKALKEEFETSSLPGGMLLVKHKNLERRFRSEKAH